MKIIIHVKGEDDMKPFTKVFDYEKSNEFIFFDSMKIIKNKKDLSSAFTNFDQLTIFILGVKTWHGCKA